MTITPDMARRWLEAANTRNRTMSMPHCERMARDMRDGRWVLTHEGIAFSSNGRLLDGQHRLQAIVMAGVPVDMFVWFDVPAEALMTINSGRRRTLVDSLTLSEQAEDVTHQHIATLRAMLGGMGAAPTLTPHEAAAAYHQHRDAIDFAMIYLVARDGIRGIATGPTRGVVARAYYSADLDRLESFCRVLSTGMATHPDDAPAALLFTYLLRSGGGGTERLADRYGKTERALSAFLRREPLARLYAATQELFPLPDEK
jgi:hypothetical protein